MSALLEKILSRDNMLAALDKVKANKNPVKIPSLI